MAYFHLFWSIDYTFPSRVDIRNARILWDWYRMESHGIQWNSEITRIGMVTKKHSKTTEDNYRNVEIEPVITSFNQL